MRMAEGNTLFHTSSVCKTSSVEIRLLRRLQEQTHPTPPRGKIHPFSKIAVTKTLIYFYICMIKLDGINSWPNQRLHNPVNHPVLLYAERLVKETLHLVKTNNPTVHSFPIVTTNQNYPKHLWLVTCQYFIYYICMEGLWREEWDSWFHFSFVEVLDFVKDVWNFELGTKISGAVFVNVFLCNISSWNGYYKHDICN